MKNLILFILFFIPLLFFANSDAEYKTDLNPFQHNYQKNKFKNERDYPYFGGSIIVKEKISNYWIKGKKFYFNIYFDGLYIGTEHSNVEDMTRYQGKYYFVIIGKKNLKMRRFGLDNDFGQYSVCAFSLDGKVLYTKDEYVYGKKMVYAKEFDGSVNNFKKSYLNSDFFVQWFVVLKTRFQLSGFKDTVSFKVETLISDYELYFDVKKEELKKYKKKNIKFNFKLIKKENGIYTYKDKKNGIEIEISEKYETKKIKIGLLEAIIE